MMTPEERFMLDVTASVEPTKDKLASQFEGLSVEELLEIYRSEVTKTAGIAKKPETTLDRARQWGDRGATIGALTAVPGILRASRMEAPFAAKAIAIPLSAGLHAMAGLGAGRLAHRVIHGKASDKEKLSSDAPPAPPSAVGSKLGKNESFDGIRSAVQSAVEKRFNKPPQKEENVPTSSSEPKKANISVSYSVREMFPGYAILSKSGGEEGGPKEFKIDYALHTDGSVTLGEKLTPMEQRWIEKTSGLDEVALLRFADRTGREIAAIEFEKTAGPMGLIQRGLGTAANAVMKSPAATRMATGAVVGAVAGAATGHGDQVGPGGQPQSGNRLGRALIGGALGAAAGKYAPNAIRSVGGSNNAAGKYLSTGMTHAAVQSGDQAGLTAARQMHAERAVKVRSTAAANLATQPPGNPRAQAAMGSTASSMQAPQLPAQRQATLAARSPGAAPSPAGGGAAAPTPQQPAAAAGPAAQPATAAHAAPQPQPTGSMPQPGAAQVVRPPQGTMPSGVRQSATQGPVPGEIPVGRNAGAPVPSATRTPQQTQALAQQEAARRQVARPQTRAAIGGTPEAAAAAQAYQPAFAQHAQNRAAMFGG